MGRNDALPATDADGFVRDKTGAGMMDCKRALTDAAGNDERAIEILRERGLVLANRKEGRALGR